VRNAAGNDHEIRLEYVVLNNMQLEISPLKHITTSREKVFQKPDTFSHQNCLLQQQQQNNHSMPIIQVNCVSWRPHLRTEDIVGAKFYCPHAPADDNSSFISG